MVEMKARQFIGLLAEMESIRGRHTELVSVYVPAGYNILKVAEQLRNEQSTAMNIKSKQVRKNVLAALDRILQHLKGYRQTPEKGLAVFCGNVAEKEGQTDIQLFVVEPLEPVRVRLYQCDQEFVLGPLKEMVEEKEVYGLVCLDGSEADVGLLKGKRIEPLKHMESIVPGKTKKGGWCVHEDTVIRIAGGEERVSDLKEGRKLMCINFRKPSLSEGLCKRIFKRKAQKALTISTGRRRITVTPEHIAFLSSGGRTKMAGDLRLGDTLLVMNGSSFTGEEIRKIAPVRPEGLFYDIEVPEHENFIANGIVLHNSANRFARVREGLLEDFLKKVGELASEEFRGKPLKGILVGGPGPIKDQFLEGSFLQYEVKRQVLGLVSTSYTGEVGLKELVERGEGVIAQASAVKEHKLLERFFTELATEGLAVYGKETLQLLRKGSVGTLLLSESYLKAHEKELESLLKEAESRGTLVEVISPHSPRGGQLEELGGIGGILRYKG